MALLPRFTDLTERRERLRAARESLPAALRAPHQVLGKRFATGCVALEVTQRCNLDCTLCYLSENSERGKDVPLAALFERLHQIRAAYGEGTAVQITGGDPTLRKRDDLLAIVREARALGLEASLLTNGIIADRQLLIDLALAGLNDAAFHIDLTQERKGCATEVDLNSPLKNCTDSKLSFFHDSSSDRPRRKFLLRLGRSSSIREEITNFELLRIFSTGC